MAVEEFLEKVAYIGKSTIPDDDGEVYYSKFDNSYLTRVGMEEHVEFLAERGITEELSHGLGFSPEHGKWYGWSHRAIYGFKIGSTCKKGDCHYKAANLADEIEDAIRFWTEDGRLNVTAEKVAEGEIKVSWTYSEDVPNKKLRGEKGSVIRYFNPAFGRGEWVAKTMNDAKEMAKDFRDGIS